MQYPDIGTQYRSEIFYENEAQKKTAEKYKRLFNEKISGKIETNITEIKNYCKAEEYHQKYIMKRGN
jgi:peptide-methionine (S)-S-oxide reductase